MSGFGRGLDMAFKNGMQAYRFGVDVKKRREQDEAERELRDYMTQHGYGGQNQAPNPNASGATADGVQPGLPNSNAIDRDQFIEGLIPLLGKVDPAKGVTLATSLRDRADRQARYRVEDERWEQSRADRQARYGVEDERWEQSRADRQERYGVEDKRYADTVEYRKLRDQTNDKFRREQLDATADERKFQRGRQEKADTRAEESHQQATGKALDDKAARLTKSLYYALASGDEEFANDLVSDNADMIARSLGMDPKKRRPVGVEVVGNRVTLRIANSDTKSEGPMTAGASSDPGDAVQSIDLKALGHIAGIDFTKGGQQKRTLLANGQPVTEADIDRMYKSEWAPPDPSNPMRTIWRKGAPTFMQYRNSVVAPEFRIETGMHSGSDQAGGISDSMAMERAQAEASDRAGWFRSDKADFAQDGGSREAFITRRYQEIKRGGAAGMAPPQAGAKPKDQGSEESTVRRAPAAAEQYLRQYAARNPRLVDEFKAKYGYVPEGI